MKKDIDVINVFLKAIDSIPAYRTFLKKHHVDASVVKKTRDIHLIPQMNKKNYLSKDRIFNFYPKNTPPPFMYASSGSSGRPVFWGRGDAQEEMGGIVHEMIFREIFKIKKHDSTLVVICFSMGIWVAGGYTLAACRHIADMGYSLTTVTPGIETRDVMYILKNIAPRFKNIVIVGYPPFLMDIFKEIKRSHVPIRNNIFVITAGDKHSEQWRNTVLSLLPIKNISHIINIYGSADATLIGHETPLTIFLRRRALVNKDFYSDLLGDSKNSLPGIFQYHPNYVHLEEHDHELILTMNTFTPLVRYNIHDTGKVIPIKEIIRLFKKHQLFDEAEKLGILRWNFPIVAISGRTDVAATFYALNIYPENIRAALEDRRIEKILSGNFAVYNKNIYHDKSQRLYIELELRGGKEPNKAQRQIIESVILEKLLELNIEFKKLHQMIQEKALPIIRFRKQGNVDQLLSIKRGLVSIKGKKPRVLV